jgi:hypothetical protein
MSNHSTIINSYHNYTEFASQPLFNFLELNKNSFVFTYLFFKYLEDYFNLKKSQYEKFIRENDKYVSSKTFDLYQEDFSLKKSSNLKLDVNEFLTLYQDIINKEVKDKISDSSK